MHERIHDALASHADEYAVRRQLHDVPPYEVYEVSVDGRRAVCKLDAHPEADAATEGRVAEYVGRETTVPVPEVLAVGADHYLTAWRDEVPDEGGHGGDPEDERGDDDGHALDAWARPAGAGLATLHAETAFAATGFPVDAGDGLAVEEHDTWADTVRAFLRRRRAYLAGTGDAHLADAAIAFVDDHPEAFAVDGDEPAAVLCHGNWLPDHVGVGEPDEVGGDRASGTGRGPGRGDVRVVIDFEHALVAPGEYDYWRATGPVFYGGRDEPDPGARAFRRGYESVRPLPEGFDRRRDLYRLVNGVSYVRSLFLQNQHGPGETERRVEALRGHVEATLAELRARTR